MALFDCSCRKDCTLVAVIASLIVGIVAAFLQITAVIAVTPVFLWVALGIAVVYLGVLQLAAAVTRRAEPRRCLCSAVGTVLAGILGTILFAVVLLAVGITATSVVSAILIGLLAGFLTLLFAGSACLIKCQTDCQE